MAISNDCKQKGLKTKGSQFCGSVPDRTFLGFVNGGSKTMNATRKHMIYLQDRHEALKILLDMSEPEIWLEYAEWYISVELQVKPRTARKMVKYWVKRWNFKTNTEWDWEVRGLWAMKPRWKMPLFNMKDLGGTMILDTDNHKFSFSLPIQK